MTHPGRTRGPLAWARRFLRPLLPPDETDAILGDLEEGYRKRRTGPSARLWLLREVVAYGVRVGLPHLSTLLIPREPSEMIRDLRFAARRLLRQPAFSFVIITTLALGIAANATVFSVVDAVLFRPLPVEAPERLVELYGSSERDANAGGMFQGFLPISYPNFEDIRDEAASLDGVFVHTQWPINLTAGSEAERVQGLYVSAAFFDVLGVRALHGRTFRPDEDLRPGGDALVVLEHGFWTRRFAADPSIVGQTVTINTRAMEVIGVAPPGFRGTNTTLQPDVFVPVSMIGDVPPWGPLWTNRGLRFFNVGARIAPSRSLDDVRAELIRIGTDLADRHPDVNRNRGIQALPLQEARVGPNQATLMTRTGGALLVAAALVLLIACMNVANLLLARALSRGDEMALRTSLGASRGHLVRQLMSESGLLFAIGTGVGLAGVLLALSAIDGFRPPAFAGGALDVRLDARVLGFALSVTALCAIAFGVLPSLRAASAPAAGALRTRSFGSSLRTRLAREGLVLGQVALSVVALGGAVVFLNSLAAARTIDPGFEVERLGMLQVDLAAQGYEPSERHVYYRRMLEEAQALPGVEAAAVGAYRPLGPAPLRRATRVDEDRQEAGSGRYVRVEAVSPGFLAAMGIQLEAGRPLASSDRAGSALVAVPNRAMADLLWPEATPLGQRFHISLVDDPIEVVGVAATTRTVSMDEEDQPVLYVPIEQHDVPAANLFVRMRDDGALERARQAVLALDPTLPVFGVTTADALVSEDLWIARTTTVALGLFGLIGLFLASVGIYGVVAHSVRERTREMGLRVALGADRGSVLRSSLARILGVVAVGGALGVLASAFALDALSGIVIEGAEGGIALYAGVAAVMVLVAACAAFLPARRATAVDPMVVLRGE